MLDPFTVRHGVPPASGCTNHDDPMYEPNNQCSTSEQPARIAPEHGSGQVKNDNVSPACQLLLRKEVIQPHLPVRLPCYDFVRIARPTFDGSLPKGLGHRLRVLPTFLT